MLDWHVDGHHVSLRLPLAVDEANKAASDAAQKSARKGLYSKGLLCHFLIFPESALDLSSALISQDFMAML